MENNKPSFHASAETQAVVKRLLNTQVGDIVTWDEIGKTANTGSMLAIRSASASARRILLRENAYVFSAVHGIGIKRLDDSEIVDLGRARVTHVRRYTRKTKGILSSFDITKLTPEKKTEALLLQAQTGAIELSSSLATSNKLEQKILQGSQLQVGDILSLFK